MKDIGVAAAGTNFRLGWGRSWFQQRLESRTPAVSSDDQKPQRCALITFQQAEELWTTNATNNGEITTTGERPDAITSAEMNFKLEIHFEEFLEDTSSIVL